MIKCHRQYFLYTIIFSCLCTIPYHKPVITKPSYKVINKVHVPGKAHCETMNIWTTHFLKPRGAEVDPQTNSCANSELLAGQHVYDEKQ